jgi:DNA-binding CsgD family transcriptional regulator
LNLTPAAALLSTVAPGFPTEPSPLKVAVHSGHKLLQASLEQLVVSSGFCAAPIEHADVALWELCSCTFSFPVPPPLPTLAIIYADDRHALEVLRLGYRGYLQQTSGQRQLREALLAVRRGEVWSERHILSKALDTRNTPHFTEREREVLALVSSGLSNKEIAQRLKITENTVKGYVSKLLDKLEVKNRTAMITNPYWELAARPR